jgi:hypothetical protein
VIIGGLIAEEKKIRAIMSPLTYLRKMKSVCKQATDLQAFTLLSGHNNAVVRDNEQEHCCGDRTFY